MECLRRLWQRLQSRGARPRPNAPTSRNLFPDKRRRHSARRREVELEPLSVGPMIRPSSEPSNQLVKPRQYVVTTESLTDILRPHDYINPGQMKRIAPKEVSS